jgi:hypothetical protein
VNLLRKSLVGVTVVGLAIDAYIHLRLAPDLTGVGTSITEADLFRIEAGMAIVAAVLLLVRPNRWTAGLAALVAGGGTFALLLYYLRGEGDHSHRAGDRHHHRARPRIPPVAQAQPILRTGERTGVRERTVRRDRESSS